MGKAAANFVSKTQRRNDDQLRKQCHCDPIACTCCFVTDVASTETPSSRTVANALLNRETKHSDKKSAPPSLNWSERPPTNYNRWTLPPTSHPLSRRKYSALYYTRKGQEAAASRSETQATRRSVILSPPPYHTDSFRQYRRVNLDTDFIANFSYTFFHGNEESRDTDSITTPVKLDSDSIANFNYDYLHDDIV